MCCNTPLLVESEAGSGEAAQGRGKEGLRVPAGPFGQAGRQIRGGRTLQAGSGNQPAGFGVSAIRHKPRRRSHGRRQTLPCGYRQAPESRGPGTYGKARQKDKSHPKAEGPKNDGIGQSEIQLTSLAEYRPGRPQYKPTAVQLVWRSASLHSAIVLLASEAGAAVSTA